MFISTQVFGGCLIDSGVMRSSPNCTGLPTIDKFFDPVTFGWYGKQFLTVNDGNELELWDITTPAFPVAKTQSNFNVPNMGDSDYDLLNQSVCDDCRFGIGIWKKGTVVWDFGSGATPVWGARKFYITSQDPRGAFTYQNSGNQYIIAKYLPGDMGGDGTVYRVISTTALAPVQKIDVPGTLKITNGIRKNDYLYLGMTDNWVYLYRIVPSGLEYVKKTGIRGFMLRGKSVSRDNGYMVSAFLDGVKLWKLADPVNPELLWKGAGDYRLAALSRRFIMMVDSNDNVVLLDIQNRRNPVEVDPTFWNPANPWNQHSECDFETGAAFSGNGWYLFMTRYAVLQKINLKDCIGID